MNLRQVPAKPLSVSREVAAGSDSRGRVAGSKVGWGGGELIVRFCLFASSRSPARVVFYYYL